MKHRISSKRFAALCLMLLLTLSLLMACGDTDSPPANESDTPARTETDTIPASDTEAMPETAPETHPITETDPIPESIPESIFETESETVLEPQGTPTEIPFDGESILPFIKASGCKTELYQDTDKGTVLKVQVTKPMNYLTIDYESYMATRGHAPIDIADYRYVIVTLKTGAGYGDAYASSTLIADCAAGTDEECSTAAGVEGAYSAKDTAWQTVVVDLSGGNWSGSLHSLLLTPTLKTRDDESYCIASVSFARTMLDILKTVDDDTSFEGLEMELNESKIDGVDLTKKNAPDEDATVDMWFDHVSERKPQNDTTSSGLDSYLIRMPGNSIEGCQFFLAPESDRAFSLSLSPFTNEAGHALRTELFYERYYLVEDTMIPDALPPVKGDIEVKANNSQGFYIKVWADPNEPAGLYTAELEIKDAATGKIIKVATVYTYVWNFSLSDETAMKTAVGFNELTAYLTYENRGMTDMGYEEIWKMYYDFLLENRLCSYNMPYKLVDGRVWEYLNNPRVNTFKIRDDEATAYSILSQYPELAKKGYFYLVDEPTNITLLNNLKGHANRLETTYPGYRMISPFFTNIETGGGVDQIEFMQSCVSIWNTKIFAFTPRKYSFISGTQYLMTEKQEEKYGTFEERMAAEVADGDDLWVYFCWEPGAPYVNWLLTGDGTEPIVSVWQCRNTKCTGLLYWETTWWTENMQSAPAGVDVWGDGVLLYSGAEYGIYDPVSSLRLENIRDGIEDYQMLSMVEKMAGAEVADELTALVSVNVLAYTTDDAHLHAARVLLGEKVESLSNAQP